MSRLNFESSRNCEIADFSLYGLLRSLHAKCACCASLFKVSFHVVPFAKTRRSIILGKSQSLSSTSEIQVYDSHHSIHPSDHSITKRPRNGSHQLLSLLADDELIFLKLPCTSVDHSVLVSLVFCPTDRHCTISTKHPKHRIETLAKIIPSWEVAPYTQR